MPCRNFAAGVEQVAERNPDVPVCLFLGALPASTAAQARRLMIRGKRRYIPLGVGSFMPLVAVLWPYLAARSFLYWSRTAKTTRADDGNAARWVRQTRQQVLVTVPSLVEHNDAEPSVKGGRAHVPWKEGWRKALFLAEDALDYEW